MYNVLEFCLLFDLQSSAQWGFLVGTVIGSVTALTENHVIKTTVLANRLVVILDGKDFLVKQVQRDICVI